ncbi:glycosyl transferase family 2 [Clostridium sp. DL-VIII]|uniref:glycosyltransferase family 2 protein n=1 Tax=Clostridium sp. DL-VIII TaxID=641107 RepID=UPI00023AFC84|nr:glycosyltransferase [Clostridium sp. DL-VIII]EHI98321.1 glycosyl transferase family 2 [Clostridium sp. DL-VIII]
MNIDDIKVSVIVPIYNVEKYLPRCVESIMEQTHKNIEVILVDDGSPDHAGEIADSYAQKDKRIKVIHKKNAGVSAARNTGIDAATGDYVCFSDADDYLMPDYVEYLLDLSVKNDADISLTKEMFTTFYPNQIAEDKQEIYTAEETTVDILSYNIPIGVYCKLFKRDFLGNDIRFIPTIFIGEGFNFNITSFQRANKVAIGRKRIYFYRRNNPTSATTKFSAKKWENGLMAIENIKKNFIIHSSKIDIAWKYASWHTNCDVFNFMVMASAEKEYPEMFKKSRRIARTQAQYAFLVRIRPREKLRAVIMVVCPYVIPKLMMMRNKKYFG